MLDAAIQNQLRAHFDKLRSPIELVAALDDTQAGRELEILLAELVSLSDRISVREAAPDAALRRPSFGIARLGEAPRVFFAGVPLGHEFTSLVLALLQVSGHPPRLEPEVIAAIERIDGVHHFETFISLSCHNCPEVVQALNVMAALNPRITHTMVDGALFQDEVESRRIMGVPAVFDGAAAFHQGRSTIDALLARLDTAAPAEAAARLAELAPFDVLVVGGGPAGASAAIYAARKGIRTGLVAERFGGQVGDTLGIENLISVAYTEGPQLAAALESQVRANGVEIVTQQRVAAVSPGDHGGFHTLQLDSGAVLRSRSLILAPGARWRELGVPGEAEYKTRGVAFCPHCDGPLFKGKRVAVVGGGNSGVEAAIDLAGIVEHVTVLEFDGQLRADSVLQKRLASLPNVHVIVNAATAEIVGDGEKVTGLIYKDRMTGELHAVNVAGIFVQIGLVPNTDWLKASVGTTRYGEIVVDDRGRTSVPGIFAAGDATTTPYKQIVVALGDGAKASLSAFDYLIRQ